MRHLRAILLLVGVVLINLAPLQQALAVNPDEILADPVLEQRARNLSAGLRCLVCQNQSIDDSDADLARDLRLLVRERLTIGDSDAQIIEYLVARYGEFVLLNPRLSIKTILLWSTPIVLLMIGGIVLVLSSRKRKKTELQPLSKDEKATLANLLDDREERA